MMMTCKTCNKEHGGDYWCCPKCRHYNAMMPTQYGADLFHACRDCGHMELDEDNLHTPDTVRFGYEQSDAIFWQVIYKTEAGDDFCRESYLVAEHPTRLAIKRYVAQKIRGHNAAPMVWANAQRIDGALIERW